MMKMMSYTMMTITMNLHRNKLRYGRSSIINHTST